MKNIQTIGDFGRFLTRNAFNQLNLQLSVFCRVLIRVE